MKQTIYGIALLALACGSAQAATVTANYTNVGTFQTASLNQDGITVTGSANVNVLNANGLGIVGGLDNNTIDTNESIQFLFNDGAAANVSYYVAIAGNTNGDGTSGGRTLEAFDINDVSLGTIAQTSAGTYQVSSLFGGVNISRFTLTSPGSDYYRVNSVTYDTVPVPAAVWLFGSALGLMGVMRRKLAS